MPQSRRATSPKGWNSWPARGSQQVINSHIGGVKEHIRLKDWGVPPEIGSRQAETGTERISSDGRDAIADYYTGQVGAGTEHPGIDADYTVGNCNVCQAVAGLECRTCDIRDTGGNCVVAFGFTGRIQDERCLIGIKQDSVHTEIKGVCSYPGQAGAERERRIPNAGNAIAKSNTAQIGAGIKCIVPNAGDAVRNRVIALGFAGRIKNNRGLIGIKQDPVHTEIGRVVGIYFQPGQAGTVPESPLLNIRDAVTDYSAGQITTGPERIGSDDGDAIRNRNTDQTGATIECVKSDSSNTVADYSAGQIATGIERPVSNKSDTIRNRDAGQTNAGIKRIGSNGRDAVADYNAGQITTGLECTGSNGRDAVANYGVGQSSAIPENIVPDGDNAVRNRNTFQTGAALEC